MRLVKILVILLAVGQAAHAADGKNPVVVEIPIMRGENGGRTLPHRNVVHEFRRLGSFSGAPLTLLLPKPTRPGLKTAVLLQEGLGGPILAATHS